MLPPSPASGGRLLARPSSRALSVRLLLELPDLLRPETEGGPDADRTQPGAPPGKALAAVQLLLATLTRARDACAAAAAPPALASAAAAASSGFKGRGTLPPLV
jgi:hypothetical protein